MNPYEPAPTQSPYRVTHDVLKNSTPKTSAQISSGPPRPQTYGNSIPPSPSTGYTPHQGLTASSGYNPYEDTPSQPQSLPQSSYPPKPQPSYPPQTGYQPSSDSPSYQPSPSTRPTSSAHNPYPSAAVNLPRPISQEASNSFIPPQVQPNQSSSSSYSQIQPNQTPSPSSSYPPQIHHTHSQPILPSQHAPQTQPAEAFHTSPPSIQSESNFRKNFSVIGGLKKVKKQAPNPQLIHYDADQVIRELPHIARGSFGIVYKGRVHDRPEKVVIKDLEVQNQKTIDDWRKELDVMSKCLSNPYAAQVYGYCSTGNILSIIMELFERGDLYKVLHTEKEKNPLSLLQRMRMARHTALGINYMHDIGMMHRDIKSMNILVTNDYECKLTDFGCTKVVNDRQAHNTVATGTPLWMAPEVLNGNYSFSADVYSTGLVLFEIFERKLPEFEPHTGVRLPAKFMSASVVLPCLKRDPTQRPLIAEVVKIVDKLLKTMLLAIRDLLPASEMLIVSSYLNELDKEDLSDFLDVELLALYNYLLIKSPKEMDTLIETAYGIDLAEDHGPFVPVNPPIGQPQFGTGLIPSCQPYFPLTVSHGIPFGQPFQQPFIQPGVQQQFQPPQPQQYQPQYQSQQFQPQQFHPNQPQQQYQSQPQQQQQYPPQQSQQQQQYQQQPQQYQPPQPQQQQFGYPPQTQQQQFGQQHQPQPQPQFGMPVMY